MACFKSDKVRQKYTDSATLGTMKTSTQKICIVGCGDIGRRLAYLYQSVSTDARIQAVVQSDASVTACNKSGLETFQIDLDDHYKSSRLDKIDFEGASVFYFAPPPSEGKQDTRLKTFLEKIKSAPSRIVLISTTGVYGDSQGEWIDETTPTNPEAERAYRRLSAEESLKGWAKTHNKEYMILRVPGIYAQDRLPLARLQKGLPVVNQAEAGFTNRIHADDLAQACLLAMNCSHKNETINITDGNPSTMTDYFNQVADFAGLSRPPQISLQQAKQTLSAGMISYLKESRRIKNTKMLELLNIKLKYPNLKSTLKTKE
jgi:nucleoside-diphosphate-sugar epimerase